MWVGKRRCIGKKIKTAARHRRYNIGARNFIIGKRDIWCAILQLSHEPGHDAHFEQVSASKVKGLMRRARIKDM